MKRVWVKKEHMFYKPFYKQKLKMGLVLVILMAVVFFSYQIFCMSQLNKSILFFDKTTMYQEAGSGHHKSHSSVQAKRFQIVGKSLDLLRGVHVSQLSHYSQFNATYFTCISTGTQISFEMLNDDYCDCPDDGSDEPSTNACPNGQFHCKHSMKSIPSSRINDGICDCCDTSDEWLRESPLKCPSDYS